MWKQIHAGGCLRNTLGVLPLLPLTLGLAHANPQRPAEPSERNDPPRFTVDVAMVVLPVTVLDAKGAFARGLRDADFQVLEDGIRQRIRSFRREEVPVSVGLIVDDSGSMRRKRKDVVEAAQAFVRKSNPEDELFIINFSDRPVLGLPDTELFSANSDELSQALSRASTGGKTALYDAIELGLVHLCKTTRDRKVLIIISDGGDNVSRRNLASTLETAKQADAVIYTIGLFDEYDNDRNPKVLRQFARITGGEAFFPAQPEEAARMCERIAEEIRSQYTIGYVSSNSSLDGTYRKIQVKVAGPHRSKLFVRTREGYIAGWKRRKMK